VVFPLVNSVMISLQSLTPQTATSLSFRQKCIRQQRRIKVGQLHSKSLPFWHLLPWNTVHRQGLFRNEEPLFINMDTVVKRMEMVVDPSLL
jgi:hypothetical protein